MKRNMQDSFLGTLKRDGQVVSVYLQRGVQLKGRIRLYDQFTIFLEDDEGHIVMVFKHAVTTISPSRPLPSNFLTEVIGGSDDEECQEQQ